MLLAGHHFWTRKHLAKVNAKCCEVGLRTPADVRVCVGSADTETASGFAAFCNSERDKLGEHSSWLNPSVLVQTCKRSPVLEKIDSALTSRTKEKTADEDVDNGRTGRDAPCPDNGTTDL